MIDGSEIRNKRKLLKLSLRELSAMSDISPSYISRLENGKLKNPDPRIVSRINKALQNGFNAVDNLNYIYEPTTNYTTNVSVLDSMLEDLVEILKSYNRKGDISLIETIEIMARIEKIVKAEK